MIGRKEELKTIERLLNSPKPAFLAVTGRRRVGKTYLVDQSLQDRYCFSMTGIQNGSLQQQLTNFGIKLAQYEGHVDIVPPPDWQTAFLRLRNYLETLPTDRKQVIFMDELPWIYTPRSGFIQLLAHFWNDYLSKRAHFILVICGSASSWINSKIINDQGGLHNRVTEIIHLRPFDLSETQAFLISNGIRLAPIELARVYMALGGIPFYLENIRKGESFAVAIERICFDPRGLLHNEYGNLYRALFNNADRHLEVVAMLAQHPQGLSSSELRQALRRSNSGSFQRTIKELVISGFVEEFPTVQKRKRNQLRLVDEFSLFYHRFIKGAPKFVPGMWQQLASGQAYKIWSGYAFELLCYKHTTAIKRVLGISAVYTEVLAANVAASPAAEGFQIDLILDRKDATINLFEMKFHETPFTLDKSYYEKLLRQQELFRKHTNTTKQLFWIFVTPHGLKENVYSKDLIANTLTIEDLL